jgi:hypothetical protein
VGLFTSKSKTIDLGGEPMKCLVCGNDHFWQRDAQLNTEGLTFLGLDWANASAVCCVCDGCGFIHWFLPK